MPDASSSPRYEGTRVDATRDSEMLTLQEACRYLRVPEGTLRYWRHLGTGPRSFKVGRHVRYWKVDLVVWLSEQTDQTRAW